MTLHRRLHVLFKAELLKLPLLGRVFVAGGFVPVQRENREKAMASIAAAVRSIQSGNTFLIFPEGTRSRTDRYCCPSRRVASSWPSRPVRRWCPWRSMAAGPRCGKAVIWSRPAKVTVDVGEPIETSAACGTVDDRDTLIADVRARIEAMLAARRRTAD